MAVRMTGKKSGPLGLTLTHGPSGAEIRTAPPVDNGGDGSSFSPTDLCAVSLGACASTIILLYAQRHGLPIDDLTFEVEKEMHPAPRRLGRLTVRYRITTSVDDARFQALVRAGQTCPVRLSLGPEVEVVEVYERA